MQGLEIVCGNMASDRKSECLFCSKVLDKSISLNKENSNFTTSLKMLLRQLKLEPEVDLELIETCEDCCLLLDNYGKMYRDWKLMELQLHKRIGDISDKIYLADTVPNQEDELKTWYADMDTCKDFKAVKDSSLNQLRSKIRDGCLKMEENSFPRVQLERIDKETPPPDTSQTKNSNQMLLLLGWLTSPYTAATISPAFNSEEITHTTNPKTAPGGKLPNTSSAAINPPQSIDNLSLHQNTLVVSSNHAPRRFSCTMCPTTLTRKHDLIRHLRKKHIKVENPPGHWNTVQKFNTVKRCCTYKCDKCGKSLSNKWSLDRHKVANACQYKKVEGVKGTLEFVCQFCNKSFRKRSHLERHIASWHRFHHENGREFRHRNILRGEAAGILFCAFCGIKESSRAAMTNHIRNNHRNIGQSKQAAVQ